jgi:tripartite-type tricarboxylate transporter receptor subunit TctC
MPAGAPPAIVKKRETAVRDAVRDPGVQEKLKAMAVNPGGIPGDEFRRIVDGDITKFADVVTAASLHFEE